MKEVKHMYCSNCGKQVNDGERFCPYCGSPLGNQNTVGKNQQNGAYYQNPQSRPPQKNKNFLLLILIIVIIAAIATVVIVFVVSGSSKNAPVQKDSQTEASSDKTGQTGSDTDTEDNSESRKETDKKAEDEKKAEEEKKKKEAEEKKKKEAAAKKKQEQKEAEETAGAKETAEEARQEYLAEQSQAEHPEKFIFPDSDSVVEDSGDIEQLSDQDLRIAINEIYARHGYHFSTSEMQNYFNNTDWYYDQGITSQSEIQSKLNSTEKENLRNFSAERAAR